MKIGHMAMYVHDLEACVEFFETYFSGKRSHLYHNGKTGFSSYFLSFADSPRLEVMNRPDVAATPDKACCGYAHLAFQASSREEVDAMTRRLQGDGYTVVSGPRVTGDGCYESCIAGPEGYLIEITE